MGRARKQRHGEPLSDGKGRTERSADDGMIPRQAKSSLIRHRNLSKAEVRTFKKH